MTNATTERVERGRDVSREALTPGRLRLLALLLATLAVAPLGATGLVGGRAAPPDPPASCGRCAPVTVAATPGATVSRDRADAVALKALGLAQHEQAVRNVDGAATRAVTTLAQAHALDPADAEVIAYLGSARTMAARDAWSPLTWIAEVREGLALIDRAVEAAPGSVAVRLVRANARLRVPAFLDGADHARADLELIARLGADTLSCPLVAEVHFKLAQTYRARNDGDRARAEWACAVRAAPESAWGRAARQRLGS